MKIIRWTTKERIEALINRDTTLDDFVERSLVNGGRNYGEWYTYKIEINVDDIKESK